MQVGPYVVEQLLGKGGMGTVHKARHSVLGTHVALKELTHSDPAARTLFLQEARMLFGMKHPSFPTVLDLIEHKKKCWLVMDFVDGPTLASVIAQRHLSSTEACLVGVGLCGALGFLHTAGMLHRDIKPDNILLPRGLSQPVLVDFGIASTPSGLSAQAYTPGMAPPEQVQGHVCGPWSDVYQVGATLFCCVTGSSPPESTTRLGEADLGPNTTLLDCQPGHFPLAVRWALKLGPADRPRSAELLMQALQGAPRVEPLPPPVVRARPFDIRR